MNKWMPKISWIIWFIALVSLEWAFLSPKSLKVVLNLKIVTKWSLLRNIINTPISEMNYSSWGSKASKLFCSLKICVTGGLSEAISLEEQILLLTLKMFLRKLLKWWSTKPIWFKMRLSIIQLSKKKKKRKQSWLIWFSTNKCEITWLKLENKLKTIHCCSILPVANPKINSQFK